MSTLTPNIGLIKPELSDPADITALNANWDKIDEKLATMITYGTEDVEAGSTSPYPDGTLYLVIE